MYQTLHVHKQYVTHLKGTYIVVFFSGSFILLKLTDYTNKKQCGSISVGVTIVIVTIESL